MQLGMIFDLDGTLVDTNDAHTEAWRKTFSEFGHVVPRQRIFPEIGKGGDKLVPSILGEEVDERDGDAMRKRVGEIYRDIARRTHMRLFPGAIELLERLRRDGIRTALATSSQKSYVDATMDSAGVDLRELVDVVVTGSDAEATKPDPDLVQAAIRKLRVSAACCRMVGDTPHDGEACQRAGVPFVGVTCGGHRSETLREAGAFEVWRDPQDVLEHLDRVLAG